MKSAAPIVGRMFTDDRLDLTGKTMIGCLFDGCILEVKSNAAHAQPTLLANCVFTDCLQVGEGWTPAARHNWRRSF